MIRTRNLSLKHRILLPNVLYAVLIGAILFFFFSLKSSTIDIAREQSEMNGLSEGIRELISDVNGYMTDDLPYSHLENEYNELISKLKIQKFATSFEQLWDNITKINDLRQTNAAIEAQIMEMTTSSIKISDNFIKEASEKLADEKLRSEVSTLERLTIIGANISTSSNYRVQVQFGHLKKSLKAKNSMLAFLDALVTNVEKDAKQLKGTSFEQMVIESRDLILKVKELTLRYISNLETIDVHQQAIFAGIESSIGDINAITTNSNKVLFDKIQNYFEAILVIILVIAILGGAISFLFARSLSGIISRIAEGLAEGADQVASASEQVSSSSQLLAERASEQAASLEETSSSLEEMTTMTTRNSEHAGEADSLMKNIREVVNAASDSMTELTAAMNEISTASEKTQRIVKTIDEIAFQTNLLALNAAVEAARAGETGAGFAVVAGEVKNLAMRAAEAAKGTAGLIEGTVRKIRSGSEIVVKTNDAFSKVQENSGKIGELVAEIAAASKEQAHGISQINKAVDEMDKLVQQNAANAEENAGASEEMSAHAYNTKEYVGELVALVGGNGGQVGAPIVYKSIADSKKELEFVNG